MPLTATDFTPFAQQLKNASPDLVYIAWAGTTARAMWQALDQQNVFQSVKTIVTGLAERATYAVVRPGGREDHSSSRTTSTRRRRTR